MQIMESESEVAQSCPTLSDPMDLQPYRLLHPWDFPGKSTGVGCHCLLQIKSRVALIEPTSVGTLVNIRDKVYIRSLYTIFATFW